MSAVFWYYANGRTIEEVDLGRSVQAIEGPWHVRTGNVSQAISGFENTITLAVRARFTVKISGILNSTAMRRDLESFVHWARRGSTFAFAGEKDKAQAAWIQGNPQSGDTVLVHNGNPWLNFNPSALLSSGDEVVIQSASPEYLVEETTVASATTTSMTLASGLRSSYNQGPILGRHRDFWPMVKVQADQRSAPALFVNNHRWTYELMLPLEEDIRGLAESARNNTVYTGADDTTGGTTGAYVDIIGSTINQSRFGGG